MKSINNFIVEKVGDGLRSGSQELQKYIGMDIGILDHAIDAIAGAKKNLDEAGKEELDGILKTAKNLKNQANRVTNGDELKKLNDDIKILLSDAQNKIKT